MFYRILVDNDWGGICPTFIQLSPNGKQHAEPLHIDATSSDLAANIMVPLDNALLRSDIPIYGVAGGTNFLRYRVEYGEGRNPLKWHVIEASDRPQDRSPDFSDISWMQGDLDLRGNLATWNTGLKNWEHLPWHPAEDATDFNGIYTIRLVVEDKNGETSEDRVTCEVGRVIAQCLPGIAVSPDRVVTMRFPEQSLPDKFRVYTILPFNLLRHTPPAMPEGMRLLSDAYRIREAGDKFIKDVTLEFSRRAGESLTADNVGICRYDTVSNEWVWMPTHRDESGEVFSTSLQELALPEAVYALAFDSATVRSSLAGERASTDASGPVRPGVFLENPCEQRFGTVKTRDRGVGANLSLVDRESGGRCIQATSPVSEGNFSLRMLDQAFDVREYSMLSFDCRMDTGVNIDLYARVARRWYRIGLTGQDVDLYAKDVNIADLGALPGVSADGNWHSYRVDLAQFLRKKTNRTKVEEVVLANWTVGGYMALNFGRNKPGARIWLDNIRVAAGVDAEYAPPSTLWVDRFDGKGEKNEIGHLSGVFESEPHTCRESRVKASHDEGPILALDVDVSRKDTFGGYWTMLGDRNLTEYGTLSLRILTTNALLPRVSLKDTQDREVFVPTGRYATRSDKTGWLLVQIPLGGLDDAVDLEHVAVITLGFSHGGSPNTGRLLVDDIRFEPARSAWGRRIPVDNFEGTNSYWNLVGGRNFDSESGAGSVHSTLVRRFERGRAAGHCLMLAYGGDIGLDLGPDGFSFSGWKSHLGGLDLSSHRVLELSIRGSQGGEKPNIYLTDGVMRRGVDLEKYGKIDTQWRVLEIPLRDFAAKGIDLTHVESLEFVFEWDRMSGSISVDDIAIK